MKKNYGIVGTIAIIYSVCYVISLILMIVFLALQSMDWVTFLILLISSTIELILVWALNNALTRITMLENILQKKDIVNSSDFEEEIKTYNLENNSHSEENVIENGGVGSEASEDVRFCSECGFQLFPEDTVCPFCGKEVGGLTDKSKKNNEN